MAQKFFIEEVQRVLPNFLNGFDLLLEPRPKREEDKLYFCKLLRTFTQGDSNDDIYLIHLLRMEPTDLGGTKKDNIITPARQGRTQSSFSNRLYFSHKILVAESLDRENEKIQDFKPLRIQDDQQYQTTTSSHLSRFTSELFDEQNYESILKQLIEELESEYQIQWREIWKLGRIYSPFQLEYGTIVLKPLNFHSIFSDLSVDMFSEAILGFLDRFRSGIWKKEMFRAYFKYLKSFDTERTLSPSGNMLWKVVLKDFPV